MGAGRSVEFAYRLGCQAIRLAGIGEHLIPVLKQKTDSALPLPKNQLSITFQGQETKEKRSDTASDNKLSEPDLTAKILYTCKTYRIPLTDLIARYYKQRLQDANDAACLPDNISVISRPHFLPDEPLEVRDLDLKLVWDEDEPSVPEFISRYDMASILKSQTSATRLYNGFLYRLLDTDGQVFRFCPGTYFKFLNTCEYLSYELASAIVSNQFAYNIVKQGRQQDFHKVASFLMENEQLIPLRVRSDPFDFQSRCTAFGTCALVVIKRAKKEAYFVLNTRSNQLSETPGLKHVIPAGTFQPNFQDDHFHKEEFSFVENIVREFTEELLDDDHLRGDAKPVFKFDDMYNDRGKAFRREVIDDDNAELFYLGLIIDPINLKPEILSVLMIHEAYLKSVCGKNLQESWETQNTRLEYKSFTEERLRRLLNKPFVPTGKAHIWLTLKHFNFLSSKLAHL